MLRQPARIAAFRAPARALQTKYAVSFPGSMRCWAVLRDLEIPAT